MHTIEPRPRGADGIILGVLAELAGPEYRAVSISLVDLAAASGYTVQTVQTAVRRLEASRHITRAKPDRGPTCYSVIPQPRRRALAVAELVGLIAPAGAL